jgi:hypothetical protein
LAGVDSYASAETGQYEIYVRDFPEGGGRWQVSSKGGKQPWWRRDGRELFYVESDTVVAVPVKTEPTFSTGVAERLFKHEGLGSRRGHQYNVTQDGQRFLLVELVGEAPAPTIRVVLNWYEEFRDRQ